MPRNFVIRRVVDIAMTIAIVILMAFQITGEAVHEWMGIVMFILFISHTILNRAWYKQIVKGRYSAVRTLQTVLDLALLVSFCVTAVSGMMMSQYAVPFLRASRLIGSAQSLHLAFSHWTFILISAHLGLHWGMMIRPLQKKRILFTVLTIAAIIICGYGLALTFSSQIYSYLFFKMQFAFFDYNESALQVFCENILMMASWAMIAYELARILRNPSKNDPHRRWISIGMIAGEILAALAFSAIVR